MKKIVLIMLAFIPNFDKIRIQTKKISKKKWIFNYDIGLMGPLRLNHKTF